VYSFLKSTEDNQVAYDERRIAQCKKGLEAEGYAMYTATAVNEMRLRQSTPEVINSFMGREALLYESLLLWASSWIP